MRDLENGLLEVAAVCTARREHLEQRRRQSEERHGEDGEVTAAARTENRNEQGHERARRDDAQEQGRGDGQCHERGRRRVVYEADERPAQGDERREWRDPEKGGGQHPGHELAPVQGQGRESLRIECLVVAEPEDREHRPTEGRGCEHDDREVGCDRVAARGRQAGKPAEAEEGGPRRADREENRALADAQAVTEQAQLQSDECCNHDSPCRSSGSPTSATNASSNVPPARSWSRGPAQAMRPLTITAT